MQKTLMLPAEQYYEFKGGFHGQAGKTVIWAARRPI